MSETAPQSAGNLSGKRLVGAMIVVSAALIGGSLLFATWRVTVGLALGCLLSFLNFYWLKVSLRSLFEQAASDTRAKFTASFYLLRYLVIAIVITIAAALNVASVAAMLVGLLSFAFAVLLEAIIQLYLVIINKEEN